MKRLKKQTPTPTSSTGYFQLAKSWADDVGTNVLLSRNRYRAAFFAVMGVCGLLALAVVSLAPMQHTQLVVVHTGRDGQAWITTATPNVPMKPNWLRTQSEISHYVHAREAYDPALYAYFARAVQTLSDTAVNKDYEAAQSASNPNAPINQLGKKGYRRVHIQSILPLDSASKNIAPTDKHINLAQVNFTTTDYTALGHPSAPRAFVALIAWRHKGPPSSPSAQLANWDGFSVTRYVVRPVNPTND